MNAQAAQAESAPPSVDLKLLVDRFADELNVLNKACFPLLPGWPVPPEFDRIYMGCTAGLPNWSSYIREHVQDLIAGDPSEITQFRLQGIGNLLYQDITPYAGAEKAVLEASCFKLLELYEGKKEDLTDDTKAQAKMPRPASGDQIQMLRSALETAHATYRDIMDCWGTTFGLAPVMKGLECSLWSRNPSEADDWTDTASEADAASEVGSIASDWDIVSTSDWDIVSTTSQVPPGSSLEGESKDSLKH
ncbi:hypothetical protein NCC49_000540 [Naganishia albida]|nr:hypothetical protein NCC49_000540 [Naganishia albida]